MADKPDLPKAQGSEAPSPEQVRPPKLSDYLRVFSYATKWDVCIYILGSVASIGSGIMMPLMNVIFGKLVGQFTDTVRDSESSIAGDFQHLVNKQVLYIMGLFFGRWFLSSITKFCFRIMGIRLSAAVRLHYMNSLLAQSIQVIDSIPLGAPATAITATTNTLQIGVSERLGMMLQSISTVCAAVIVSFIWSWNITLVTSSLLLYVLLILAVVTPLIIKGFNAMTKADEEGIALASEAIGGIRLVAACGAQSLMAFRYNDRVQEARRRAQQTAPFIGLQLGLIFFGVFGSFSLAFWYGAQRYAVGAISNAGVVLVVIMSVMMIFMAIQSISMPLIDISKAIVAARDLFVVIDAPQAAPGSLKPDLPSQDIVFKDVTFEYPSRPGVTVLDGLNVCIKSGQNTALVGPSGSGKSTVVALLERWYSLKGPPVPFNVDKQKPADKANDEIGEKLEEKSNTDDKPKISGSITIGGYNLDDLDLKWWRGHIGLVQQEPFLFNDTIFNNIAKGLIGTQWEDESEERKREMVREACEEAYAEEFITRLPNGYDTRVGDGGAKLSGGQKQRLAIARSIIKKPQIVILDEATSAIDAKSEKIVQAALDRLSKNRTTITIAHRLSTIQKADHIVVLRNGKAVEEGTHHSLLANESGVYSALVRAQSLHFSNQEGVDAPELVPDDHKFDNADTTSSSHLTKTTNPETVKSEGYMIRTLVQLFKDQHPQWPSYLGIMLSSMAVAAGTPLQAWLIAKVINIFLLSAAEIKHQSDFLGLMWLALAGGVGIGYFFQGLISVRLQYFVNAKYNLEYFNNLLHQKLGFFDDDANSHGTLTSQIAGDAKQVGELFGVNLAFLLSGIFIVIGCVIISLIFSWKLGLVALFGTMPILLGTGFWKVRYEVQFEQMNSTVFSESSQFATEAIGAIRTVSALGMEPSIITRYQKLLNGHIQDAYRKALWTAALFGFADSVTLGCQALIFWYGGKLLSSGEVSLEAFFVSLMAMIQGAEGAAQALALTPNATRAAAAAKRIYDTHESVVGRSDQVTANAIPNTNGGVEIDLRSVSFKYPTRDVFVFKHLSLHIKKGQYVAFVGPSGSGKSSIISLLERFYDLDPGHGTILCNGINIHDLDVYEYRKHLSLVSQEPIMFRGTVRDNILFGIADPDSIADEKIHEVCRDVFIHDFIVSLPEGYNTDVGHKGTAMSGGQKQRIAIARAMIRDPSILFLDEATSALDSESEKIVQASVERVEGRTVIAVAHRLSTIQNADVIFVLDDGRVMESGNHGELIEKHGIYWEMCRSQMLNQ